jgi:hypothetical protein
MSLIRCVDWIVIILIVVAMICTILEAIIDYKEGYWKSFFNDILFIGFFIFAGIMIYNME